jgi:hypothetical protein
MGTHKEHYENKAKAKKYLPHSFPNEKNWTPSESMHDELSLAMWNFYLHNCLSPFLA